MAEFPDATERGSSLEQPEYSCGHEANTALSVREKDVVVTTLTTVFICHTYIQEPIH